MATITSSIIQRESACQVLKLVLHAIKMCPPKWSSVDELYTVNYHTKHLNSAREMRRFYKLVLELNYLGSPHKAEIT